MNASNYEIEYGAKAVEKLQSLPKKEADQIIRKISRLENGLHGNIKRLQNADFGYRLRWETTGFYLM